MRGGRSRPDLACPWRCPARAYQGHSCAGRAVLSTGSIIPGHHQRLNVDQCVREVWVVPDRWSSPKLPPRRRPTAAERAATRPLVDGHDRAPSQAHRRESANPGTRDKAPSDVALRARNTFVQTVRPMLNGSRLAESPILRLTIWHMLVRLKYRVIGPWGGNAA